jgi:hypothetical protein
VDVVPMQIPDSTCEFLLLGDFFVGL